MHDSDAQAPRVRGEDAVVALGPALALSLRLHGAAALRLLERFRFEGDSAAIQLGTVANGTARIDRASGALELAIRHDGQEIRFGASGETALAAASEGGGGCAGLIEALLLAGLTDASTPELRAAAARCAARLVQGVDRWLTALDGILASPTVPIPSDRAWTDAERIVAIVDRLGRSGASLHAPGTWPHALLRDAPGILLIGEPRARAFRAEFEAFAGEAAPGALGCVLASVLLAARGADDAARELARRGGSALGFQDFARDVGALCQETLAANDRASFAADLRSLWDAGLGAALSACTASRAR
ncbi:MAG: hypothetical protein HZB39_10735 [Planctomycetes bacterium]|nr:hypothetical protein [Planctomycetota bacterium]